MRDADPAADAVLLSRITRNPEIYGGKPIIRGHRMAVEHILGMMSAGDSPQTLLDFYDWLELEDIQACILYALRLVEKEHDESRRAAIGTRSA
ncbi:MAG TPA: DUF433 domain-containing protein [Thermoanaerobaculia bacterium]|nr:DUF433 domain-containing protein [Thermoanaerobaculia bacterium]